MNVNIEFIKNKGNGIRKNIEKINNPIRIKEEEFFKDERNVYTLRYLLLECIEAVAHICNHLLAKIGKKAPASYADCFEGLSELNIIPVELKSSLIKMVRFRNLLIHRYWEIDDKKVLEYAKNNLKDFEDFLKEVGKLIKGREGM